jgi:hypothetical protein
MGGGSRGGIQTATASAGARERDGWGGEQGRHTDCDSQRGGEGERWLRPKWWEKEKIMKGLHKSL